MSVAYDPQNIFAKILRGEIPAHKVYEDDIALAMMDIMPRAEGHTLVIPKQPARGLIDVDPENLAQLIKRVQHVAKAVKTAFGAEGLTLQQFNESAGGQVIFHLHFHILSSVESSFIPRSRCLVNSWRSSSKLGRTTSNLVIWPSNRRVSHWRKG